MAMKLQAKEIGIVPGFHYDVAYLKSYREYLPGCFAIIDEALRILEANPEYRFLIEQVILLEEYWERFPEKRPVLRRLAGEGQLGVAPGLFVMPDMNHPGGETMFLQARLGRKWLAEKLGISPKVCWIADCWGHHAQLPQILRQSGYEYYVFYRCMRPEVCRSDFRWEGLDGTQIKTHWLPRGYANVRFPTDAEKVNAAELEFIGCGPEQIARLCLELEHYGPMNMALLCNGGDFAFPQGSGPQVVKQLNGTGQLPPVKFTLPEEVLGQVDWQKMPVVTGEFNSSFQGTFTANIRIKQEIRELGNRLLSLEALAVTGGGRKVGKDYQMLWRGVLKQQFHDIVCGTICDTALADCLEELKQVRQGIAAELQEMGGQGDGVVFNPLGFARTEIVEQEGRRLKVQMPALGFASLAKAQSLPEGVAGELPVTFANDFYEATIGPRGYITSLVEKSSGRELIGRPDVPFGSLGMQIDNGDLWLNFESPLNGGADAAALTQNLGDPLFRRGGNALVHQGTFLSAIKQARVVLHSSEELIVEQEGTVSFWRLGIAFKTRLHLKRHSPRIAYTTTIQPNGRQYRIRAVFPSALANGETTCEIPYGMQRREKGEHVAQNWVDYSDQHCGLALLNRGIPANNVEEGVLMLTLFRAVAMEYKADSDDSFNQGVEHTFAYALVPHGKSWKTEVVRQGLEFNFPPLVCRMGKEMAEGNWGVSQENVIISCLRWSGAKIFLRIYEATGQMAQGEVVIPKYITQFAEADGLEEPTGKSNPCNGKISFKLNPYEVKGFLLSLA